MKSTNSIYLDYNSTSPLAKSFIKYLANGDICFANPSSQHQLGKSSRKIINQTSDYILSLFNISKKEYEVIYHSGATEWISTLFNLNSDSAFIYFNSDHPAVLSNAYSLSEKGEQTSMLHISSDGSIDYEKLDQCLANTKLKKWVNITLMHNETGSVVDLKRLKELKEKYGDLFIHIDAVQAIGKIENDFKLSEHGDCYTFSGHKFGALKGIGFSLVKKGIRVTPLIRGGDQQKGIRSGTENLHGILSLKYALEEISDNNIKNKITSLREKIDMLVKGNEKLILIEPKVRATNTICFLHKSEKADVLLAKFDLSGLAISSGSACSSGSLIASRVIADMGHQDLALNNLRISLGPSSLEEEELILERLTKVIGSL